MNDDIHPDSQDDSPLAYTAGAGDREPDLAREILSLIETTAQDIAKASPYRNPTPLQTAVLCMTFVGALKTRLDSMHQITKHPGAGAAAAALNRLACQPKPI